VALARQHVRSVRPSRFGRGQVVPLPLAERVLLHLLAWQKCASEFTHIAAGMDYDDEFHAYDVYEETEAFVAARCRVPIPGARPQPSCKNHDFLREVAEVLLMRIHGDYLDLIVPAELVEKLLDCLAAWESCAGRMRDFIADTDFYDDHGAASRHARTRAVGLRHATRPLPATGTYTLPPDPLLVS
jgi:hypothetical protein